MNYEFISFFPTFHLIIWTTYMYLYSTYYLKTSWFIKYLKSM